jgi:hypothetical protein
MRAAPTHLQVYECFTPYHHPPDDVVTYAEGMARVADGRANLCKHNKAIRMRPKSPGERFYRNPGGATGASAMPSAERYLNASNSGRDREFIFAIDDPTGWGREQPNHASQLTAQEGHLSQ